MWSCGLESRLKSNDRTMDYDFPGNFTPALKDQNVEGSNLVVSSYIPLVSDPSWQFTRIHSKFLKSWKSHVWIPTNYSLPLRAYSLLDKNVLRDFTIVLFMGVHLSTLASLATVTLTHFIQVSFLVSFYKTAGRLN